MALIAFLGMDDGNTPTSTSFLLYRPPKSACLKRGIKGLELSRHVHSSCLVLHTLTFSQVIPSPWLTHYRPPTPATPSSMASTGSTAPISQMDTSPTKDGKTPRLRVCFLWTKTQVSFVSVLTPQTHMAWTKDGLV